MTPPEELNVDFCLELEWQLVKTFGWSLYEIDRTDIESLLPFVMHAPATNHGDTESRRSGEAVKRNGKKELFCDQVKWL